MQIRHTDTHTHRDTHTQRHTQTHTETHRDIYLQNKYLCWMLIRRQGIMWDCNVSKTGM